MSIKVVHGQFERTSQPASTQRSPTSAQTPERAAQTPSNPVLQVQVTQTAATQQAAASSEAAQVSFRSVRPSNGRREEVRDVAKAEKLADDIAAQMKDGGGEKAFESHGGLAAANSREHFLH